MDAMDLIAKLSDKNEPVLVHGKRVARLACAIAQRMDYSGEGIKIIHHAAVVHDIGKLGMPREIIYKPDTLNREEMAVIRKHPEFGYSVLKQIMPSESAVARIALQHHERLDGSGYPFGLKAKDIIQMAKIVSVADVIDTMIYAQVYRPALSVDEAVGEIKQNSGILYDAEVVAASLWVMKDEKRRHRAHKK